MSVNKKQVAFPVGLKVTDVRMMTKEELENECWDESWGSFAVVLIFEDGSKVYASSDPEGNDVGCLFGMTKNGTAVTISPLTEGMTSDKVNA